MYWWKAGKLAEDLREGRVTEKERFKYYLATFIAYGVAAQLFFYLGGPSEVDRLISAVANLTAAALGIVLCYRRNKSGDHSDFIPRMICLGWPASVRCAMFFGICLLVAGLGGKFQEKSVLGPLSIIFILLYYQMILGYLAQIARAKWGQSEHEMMMTTALSPLEIVFGILCATGAFYIFMVGMLDIPRLVGRNSLAPFLAILITGLWVLLFYSVFVWRRRRSRKHTTETS